MENKLVNNMKIELEVPKGKVAEWVNGVLTLVDEKPKDVRDRIKTFEDACNELGRSNPLVCQYYGIDDVDSNLSAYLKLRIICAALNEGWEPQFTVYERRYYPYFIFYTQDEIDKMDEDEKQDIYFVSAEYYKSEYVGISAKYSTYDITYSILSVCSRLFLKNSDLAKYCGKQFTYLWADLNLIRK